MRFPYVIVLFVLAGAMALAACGGKSAEEQARDDGQALGEAIRAAFGARSMDDFDAAVEEIDAAKDDLVDNFSDEDRDQFQQFSSDLDAAVADIRSALEDGDVSGALQAGLDALNQLTDDLSSLQEGAGAEVKAAVEGILDGLGL
jgi:hypothetical protein